ncbi:MAG: LamG-like jellyroll fold domain-containing protein [Solirubrobacteraceae bacterium]
MAPLLVVVALLIGPGMASAATVSWWRMDETSGTTMNDSVGSHDGRLHGGVTIGRPGFDGLAYLFDGSSSYAQVSSASGLNPQASAFWFGARVNFTGDPATVAGGDYDVVRKGQASPGASFYKLELFPGGFAHCSIGGSAGSQSVTADTIDLRDGDWHSLLCLKDDNSISVVVDGVAKTKAATIGSISTSDSLAVGANLQARDWYDGLADDVAYGTGAPPPAPSIATAPAITGTAAAGSTLQADPGTWNGSPVVPRYQWRRCDQVGANCADVSGATKTTYAVTSADEQHTLRVAVVATNPMGTGSAASAPTGFIGTPPPPPPPPPPAPPSVNPVAAPPPATAAPNPPRAATCAQVLPTHALRTSVLRSGRALTLRFDARTRTVTLRAARGQVRRIVLTLDGMVVRTVRGGALRAVLRAASLRPGRHVLRATASVAGGRARVLTVHITARACT